jgi:hypothetical protein
VQDLVKGSFHSLGTSNSWLCGAEDSFRTEVPSLDGRVCESEIGGAENGNLKIEHLCWYCTASSETDCRLISLHFVLARPGDLSEGQV